MTHRGVNLAIGLGLIALGVGLSVTSEHSIYYGLVLVGVFRLARAGLAGNPDVVQRSPNSPPPADDPRWQPSTERQVVGKTCGTCTKRFITADEAEACATCKELVHVGCAARHLGEAHVGAAYRGSA